MAANAAESRSVPPDLLYVRKAIPTEEDAYIEWAEMDQILTPFSHAPGDALFCANDPIGERANSSEIRRAEAWVAKNSRALNLFEQSLNKPRAQIPKLAPDNLRLPVMYKLVTVLRARLFLADQAAWRSDQATATNILIRNLKLGRMVGSADGAILGPYQLSGTYHYISQQGILRWAWHATSDPKSIRAILAEVPELQGEPENFVRMAKTYFTEIQSGDMRMYSLEYITNLVQRWEPSIEWFPGRWQRAFQIVHDPALLALHPRPFEATNDFQSVVESARRTIQKVDGPWLPSKATLFSDTDPVGQTYLAELKPLLDATANETLPLSAAAAKKAADFYKSIRNPVGRFWESQRRQSDLVGDPAWPYSRRTNRCVARALLAIRIYRLEKGTYPESLDDLVKAKILPEAPIDYFANAPLHYSRSRQMLWSVGEDGVNNDGRVGSDSETERDTVWKFPIAAKQ